MDRVDAAAPSFEELAWLSAEVRRINWVGVWQYDVDRGEWIWSNEVFELLDLPVASTPPPLETLTASFDAEEREALEKHIRGALNEGRNLDFEHFVTGAKGQERCLRVRGALVQGTSPSGRLVGSIEDVTGAKRALQTIEAQAAELTKLKHELDTEVERFRSLFDQAPVFVALGSTPDLRFEYVNEAYCRLVGNRLLIGKTVSEALPEAVAQGLTNILTSVHETGIAYIAVEEPTQLYNQPGGDAELRYLNYIYQPIRDADGKITGVLCIGYDVTEQCLAREEADQLRSDLFDASRMAAMGTMAGTLAHELNQPLTALIMFASGLQRHLGEALTPLLKQALDDIGAEALRAGEIMKRMRAISVGNQAKREALDLKNIIADVFKSPIIACRDVVVDLSLRHANTPCGDNVQVQQVLTNIVRNACEAMDGQVNAKIRISTKDEGQEVAVRIEDNGPGITPEILPRIFEAKPSAKTNGMGIGLPICRTIIEAHGGRLGVGNKESGGAIFWFTLPLGDA